MVFGKMILWSTAALMADTPDFAQKHVNIQVQVMRASDATVHISMPLNGNYFEYNVITKQLGADNKVAVDLPINIGGVVKVSNDFRVAFLLVRPGEEFEVTFVPGINAQIKGNNALGQELYNTLSDESTRNRFEELDKYPLAVNRLGVCDSLKQVDLQKFRRLLSARKINAAFYERMKIEVDMYYRLLFSTDMLFSLRESLFSESVGIDPANSEFIKVWNGIYADVNSNKSWLKSQFYEMLMHRYSSLLNLRNKSPKDREIPYALQLIHNFRARLKGKALEYAWANGIAYGLNSNEKEKTWLATTWTAFKHEFPKSKLIKVLLPGIQKWDLS